MEPKFKVGDIFIERGDKKGKADKVEIVYVLPKRTVYVPWKKFYTCSMQEYVIETVRYSEEVQDTLVGYRIVNERELMAQFEKLN
jgi:tryptophanase